MLWTGRVTISRAYYSSGKELTSTSISGRFLRQILHDDSEVVNSRKGLQGISTISKVQLKMHQKWTSDEGIVIG